MTNPKFKTLKTIGTVSAAAALLFGLTACGGSSKSVAFGESQSIKVEDSDTNTNATIDLTIESSKVVKASDIDTVQFSGDYANGYLYLVNYKVDISEGEISEKHTYPFSHYKWQAELSNGEEVATVNLGIGAYIDGCKGIGSDDIKTLNSTKTISGCQAFISVNEDKISKVIYDRPTISYKGRDKGYSWNAAE